ncbi:MAG: peroxiredoxin [Ignavibacteriaceae bacterium]
MITKKISTFLIFNLLIFFAFFSYAGNKTNNLKEGMKAPDFTLEDVYGNSYTLSYYKGKAPVVIYFYPQANTSGCTKEACGIRDNLSKFNKNDIKVFGISVDPVEDIEKFVEDYKLDFPLLSDEGKEVTKSYGVLNDNGKAKRVTFIINKKGNIVKIIEVKDIDSHAEEVLKIASKYK